MRLRTWALIGLFFICSASSVGATTLKDAPLFTLESTKGEQVSINDFRGERMLVIFFTTWCGVCQEEMPMLSEHADELREEGINIVAINMTDEERSEEAVATVADELQFPVLYDHDGQVSNSYAVLGVPMTFAIDEDTKITARFFGSLNREQVMTAYD